MKIKMICLQSVNPENNESECLRYAPFYIDSKYLLVLDTKMAKLKSRVSIFKQNQLFRIRKPTT